MGWRPQTVCGPYRPFPGSETEGGAELRLLTLESSRHRLSLSPGPRSSRMRIVALYTHIYAERYFERFTVTPCKRKRSHYAQRIATYPRRPRPQSSSRFAGLNSPRIRIEKKGDHSRQNLEMGTVYTAKNTECYRDVNLILFNRCGGP